jgi:hypothetical protein
MSLAKFAGAWKAVESAPPGASRDGGTDALTVPLAFLRRKRALPNCF